VNRRATLLLTLCAVVFGGLMMRGANPEIVKVGTAGDERPAATVTVPVRQSAPASPVPNPEAAGDPYAALARTLHSRGVQIWFEADMVARWLEGPQSFQEALDRLGRLASVPGVQGFKVADELGYGDGIDTAAQATDFLRAVRTGLARVAPHAQVLVDVVVPELGCLAWTSTGSESCAREVDAKHPACTEAAVTHYLREGLVDRLDLSTSLLDEWTYQGWGLSQIQAQQAAWRHVNALGWDKLTVLQSRKALADAGGYQGSAIQADHDVQTFVDAPTAGGARAVDVWCWRQGYDGHTVSLLADDLAPNPLWQRLEARHRAGVRLITHITPSLLLPTKAQRSEEVARFASVFDEAFVAAGTG
jgi:hypothetical protein